MGSTWPGACSLERVHGISQGSVTPPPQIKRRASAGVPSHLSLLSKAPTLFLGILLKFVSFLLRLPFPSQSSGYSYPFLVFGLTSPCYGCSFGRWFCGNDCSLHLPWRLALRLSWALRFEFLGPLGKGSFICKIWRILLISFRPSPVFCY